MCSAPSATKVFWTHSYVDQGEAGLEAADRVAALDALGTILAPARLAEVPGAVRAVREVPRAVDAALSRPAPTTTRVGRWRALHTLKRRSFSCFGPLASHSLRCSCWLPRIALQ